MPKSIFLQRNYKLTPEKAAEWIQMAQAEQPSIGGLFGNTDINNDISLNEGV